MVSWFNFDCSFERCERRCIENRTKAILLYLAEFGIVVLYVSNFWVLVSDYWLKTVDNSANEGLFEICYDVSIHNCEVTDQNCTYCGDHNGTTNCESYDRTNTENWVILLLVASTLSRTVSVLAVISDWCCVLKEDNTGTIIISAEIVADVCDIIAAALYLNGHESPAVINAPHRDNLCADFSYALVVTILRAVTLLVPVGVMLYKMYNAMARCCCPKWADDARQPLVKERLKQMSSQPLVKENPKKQQQTQPLKLQ